MTLRAQVLSGVLALCVLQGSTGGAQPAVERLGAPIRGTDLSAFLYPRSSGLLSGTVYAMARDGSARLWIGTEDGPYSSEGGLWRLEELPPGTSIPQVRGLLFDSAGGRWLAMRTGAFRFHNGTWTTFGEREGVAGPVVFSLTETRALDGRMRVVLGAANGVCVIDNARCRPLSLPAGIGVNAFMVRSAVDANGISEFWVVSASGGAARYRNGKWSTFSNAEGLTTASAEDVILAATPTGLKVLVVGEGGAFVLETPDGKTERFVRIPGSPKSVYRAAYVPRRNWPDEFWLGTGDGFVIRRRAGLWDTLRVEGDAVRGQITLISADVDSMSTRSVFVSSRGDRMTRLSFVSAMRFNLPGRASREWVTAILQHPDPRFAGQAIVSTSDAGAVLVDTLGNARLLTDPDNPWMLSSPTAYWGPLESGDVLSPGPSLRSQLIVVGRRGPVWFPNDQPELMPGLGSAVMRRMRWITLINGEQALVGATSAGLYQWRNTVWKPMPELSTQEVTDILQTRSRDSITLFVTGPGGVSTITASGAQYDTVPHVSSLASPVMRWACELDTPAGGIVFVAGDRGTIAWRERDSRGGWRALPRHFKRAINTTKPAVVRCGDAGDLYLGSANGVLVGRINSLNPSEWEIAALIGRDDGLPSSEVTALGLPFRNRLWVGTQYGSAVVALNRSFLAPLAPVALRLSEYPNGTEVENGAVLPHTSDQLRVDVWLDNQVRENESTYNVEWRRIPSWWDPNRPPVTDAGWTNASTRYITDIYPGRYQLRVKARDFAGRETAMLEWQVEVLSPWWESWLAIFTYALLVMAGLFALYRWRIGVIQRGTAGLVESERRLQVSERKFRALFDHAQDSHLLVESGRIVSANHVAATLFGTDDPEALVGQLPDEILTSAAGTPRRGFDARDVMVHRGAETVPVQVTTTSIDTGDGVLQHLVIKDLTEMRTAERARERIESHLRERQRLEALGTLAGGIAHDFNNLLGVIRGNAELAEDSVDDAALTVEHLASIVDASNRARDLVQQILAFSQSPLPKQELVDLSQVLRSLQPLLRRMIPSSVSIELDGVDVPHVVEGDSTQLQQVLINLASNAEYAMRKKGSGELVMSLQDDVSPRDGPLPVGRVIRLAVRDTGEGMTPEVVERVFEPFFTTKPTGEGTGLGLSVLHGVVQAHGGRVRVESAPCVGTTVEITFPAAHGNMAADESVHARTVAEVSLRIDADPVAAAATAAAAARASKTPLSVRIQRRYPGARLIVVDDEPQVGRVMEKALTRFGYVVRVFHRSEDALRAVMDDVDAVDLVLTDQTMPGMTGDILSAEVHRLDPKLPVLILTGFSHKLTAERVTEVGAIAVLQKPIDLETLDLAVEHALGTAVASGRRGGGEGRL